MRHIISVLLENEPGALSRVVGLFSQRNYNIETLTVAPTEDPTLSRLTLTTVGQDEVPIETMLVLVGVNSGSLEASTTASGTMCIGSLTRPPYRLAALVNLGIEMVCNKLSVLSQVTQLTEEEA